MTESIQLESPAKINLRLEILRKREDGYHEIRTLFQKINLHDTLHFSLKQNKGIRIRTDHVGLPTRRKNLVYQATRLMLDRSDYGGGIDILIEKKIPLGAGLGGGSSNAASTLTALNKLLNLNLSRKELMVLGAQIGADVPFFLLEGSAIGSGIGDRLRKITLPRLRYILVNPGFEVSTRWAYQNFILTKVKYHINLHKLLKSSREFPGILYNDLEGVVSARYPEISLMKEMLLSAGSIGALMTGSGPTVFGLFSTEKKALVGYHELEKKVRGRGWRIVQAHSIP